MRWLEGRWSAMSPERKEKLPTTTDDSQANMNKFSDTFGVLEKMVQLTEAQNKGYIIVSLPAAHTQGLGNNQP